MKRPLFILFVFVLAFMPSVVFATQVALGSGNLPYTASSHDTITIVGTHITSTGNGIFVANDIHGVYFNLGTDTLEFGSAGGSYEYGVKFQSSYDCTVNGGTIIRNVGPGIESGTNNYSVHIYRAHDISFLNTNLVIDGHNAHCVRAEGVDLNYNLHWDGGTWRNDGTSYTSRDDYDGCIAYLGTAPALGSYDYWIEHITITDGPSQGIIVIEAAPLIDSCQIRLDHQNTYPTGTNANQYGILVTKGEPGTQIINNTIISGSNHGGCRGIMIEDGIGTSESRIVVRNNHLTLNNGPDYASPGGILRGIRGRPLGMTGELCYVDICKNVLTMTVDSDPTTTWIGNSSTGLDVRLWGDTIGSSHHIRIDSNEVYAIALDSGVNCRATSLSSMRWPDTSGMSFSHNKIYSCGPIMRLGDEDNTYGCREVVMRNNTFGFISAAQADSFVLQEDRVTWYVGYYSGILNGNKSLGNVSFDAVYENGADDEDIDFYWDTHDSSSISQRRTLRVYAKGSNGLPVSDATILVKNAYGQSVVSGNTNSGGRVTGQVTYYYLGKGIPDSTGFNDFVIYATKGADADTDLAFTVAWEAAGGTDTLTLSSTVGDGEWEEDEAPVAAFSGAPLSGNAPLQVMFTDASTNGPTSWLWQFGDDSTSTSQSPVHTYLEAGTFTVTLTATNAYGYDSEIKTNYITVSEGPAAGLLERRRRMTE